MVKVIANIQCYEIIIISVVTTTVRIATSTTTATKTTTTTATTKTTTTTECKRIILFQRVKIIILNYK